MIGVTLADLKARYRARLSETSTKFFDEAQALAFANEAQDVICSRVPFTVVTSWGTTVTPYRSEYLLPEECIHPTGTILRRPSGQIVRSNFIEPDLMDGMKSWGTASRIPTQYLQLYVEGHKRPTPLTNDTDFTDIPAQVVTAVIDYMEAMAKASDEENQEHQLAWGRFNASLERLLIDRARVQYDQFERTRKNREISLGAGWPYWCTYRHREEGTSVEIWGV